MTRTYLVGYALNEPAFPTVTNKGSRSDRGQSWLTNAFTHCGWTSFLCLFFFAASVKADVYTLPLSYNDAFLNNPYYVENAFLRTEAFAPNVKYWQPSQPNVEGIVTLKFDTPFNIQSASFLLGISAYTVGTDLNLDSNASAFLDVSTDNVNWTQVASQTNQNATNSGISGPWDISSIVSGSNVVYIRSRLFTTTSYSGYSAAQFNRQGAPYDPGYFTATGGILPECPTTVALEFNGDAGGSIKDVNGLGTGFTHRLPGTGSALPTNDPNMDLLSVPGKLRITSTHADINQSPGPTGNNLSILEAPGVYVPGIGTKDVMVKALFEDVNVLNGSDQLTLYAGVNENKVLRAGIHQGNVYIMSPNNGAGDMNTFTDANAFSTGDDIEVTLSRQSGVWSLSWNNLTSGNTGSLAGVSLPWLDEEPNLYFGILAANAGNVPPGTSGVQSFVSQIDNFTVTCIPEPSGLLVAGMSLAGLLASQGKRRRD